jgi:hypothetical protein
MTTLDEQPMKDLEQACRARVLANEPGLFSDANFTALIEAVKSASSSSANPPNSHTAPNNVRQLKREDPHEALIRMIKQAFPQNSPERAKLISHIRTQPVATIRNTLNFVHSQSQDTAKLATTPRGFAMLMRRANSAITSNILRNEQANGASALTGIGTGTSPAELVATHGIYAENQRNMAPRPTAPPMPGQNREEPPAFSPR